MKSRIFVAFLPCSWGYDANKAQNDHLYGEESWQLIRDWIIAGVNSYSAWNMVLDTVGKNLTSWPQNALLVVDRSAKKLIVTPAYYVFRHFSQYIAPGATRIGTSGSTDAVAFKNPDGSIITEVYNKGASSKKMTVGVGSALYQFDVPAHDGLPSALRRDAVAERSRWYVAFAYAGNGRASARHTVGFRRVTL